VQGELVTLAEEEFVAAKDAGLEEIINELETASASSGGKEEISAPESKTVDEEISGIDILTLDDAVHALWQADIYAESGMGCTGPVVMMAQEDEAEAWEVLQENGFIG
jgi:hypothetical protein